MNAKNLAAYKALRRIHLRLCRAGRFGDAFGPANERTLVEAQNALANLRAALAKFGGA